MQRVSATKIKPSYEVQNGNKINKNFACGLACMRVCACPDGGRGNKRSRRCVCGFVKSVFASHVRFGKQIRHGLDLGYRRELQRHSYSQRLRRRRNLNRRSQQRQSGYRACRRQQNHRHRAVRKSGNKSLQRFHADVQRERFANHRLSAYRNQPRLYVRHLHGRRRKFA